MPRTAKASGSTITRARSGARATTAAIAKPAGQLVWAGAPPGGTSYEFFQTASGWQFYLLTNTGGVISRTLMGRKEPELMQAIQVYLTLHPPTRLANRSVARTRANAIPAAAISGTNVAGTVKRRARTTRTSVTRSSAAVT